MREHLMRWLQLELSPADAAILGEMHARELGKLQHDQDDGGSRGRKSWDAPAAKAVLAQFARGC